jgi:hypothetical protein
VIDPSALRAAKAPSVECAPSGNNYIKIYSTLSTFAALKADGSIKAWGSSGSGGTGAPSGSGYTKIYSTGCKGTIS